jgi:hypothetical protein
VIALSDVLKPSIRERIAEMRKMGIRTVMVTGANPVTAIDRENSYRRRRIKMSPLCQSQITLPGGFPGGVGVTVWLMSDGELSRLEVLRDLDQRWLTTAAAGQLP